MDNDNDLATLVRAELKRISNDVDKGLGSSKAKVEELQARLLELEQRAARRPEGAGPGGAFARSAAFQAAWDDALPRGLADLKANRRNSSVSLDLPGGFFDVKAALVNPAAPGWGGSSDPVIYGPAMRRLRLRALLPTVRVDGLSVPYVLGTVTANVAPVAEGGAKPETTFGAALQQAPIVTLATWMQASSQVLEDVNGLANFIDLRMRYALASVEEAQLLNGTGVGLNLKGLMTSAAAYADGTAGRTKLDHIRRAIAALQVAGFDPTVLVLNPLDAAELDLLKTTTGEYVLSTPAGDGVSRIWTVPTVTTAAMVAGQFLIGDLGQAAYIADRWLPRVEISNSDGDDFIHNLIKCRVEERLALVTHEPLALLKGVFT